MNPRKITVQAPLQIPEAPNNSAAFLHVVCTDTGFRFRWIPVQESPIYIRASTGEKMRLTMSLTSDISKLPKHGKAVLTFEDILVSDDGKTNYKTWNPSEWFQYERQ
jgi:hypothetical protein